MVIKWKATFPAPEGPDERNVYVYLPDYYDHDGGRRYPVLYMFDGHNVFFDTDATYGKCWGLKEYLERNRTPVIVAALECNHSPKFGRLKEYSPYSFREKGPGFIKGYGNETMDWYINVFKKEIDEKFRTLPDRDHTFIAGSSMGGLMSLYALIAYNDVFSRAAALSPSIWTAPRKLEKLIQETPLDPNTVLYTDYGSQEFANHEAMESKYHHMLSVLYKKKIYVTSRIVPNGSHCEACWEKQLPFVMNTLLYDIES